MFLNHRANKKWIAFVCVMIIAGFFFSFLFTAEFTEHHCTGDHCPICLQLSAIAGNLKHILTFDTVVGRISQAIFCFFIVFIFNIFSFESSTLTGKKIRLNN